MQLGGQNAAGQVGGCEPGLGFVWPARFILAILGLFTFPLSFIPFFAFRLTLGPTLGSGGFPCGCLCPFTFGSGLRFSVFLSGILSAALRAAFSTTPFGANIALDRAFIHPSSRTSGSFATGFRRATSSRGTCRLTGSLRRGSLGGAFTGPAFIAAALALDIAGNSLGGTSGFIAAALALDIAGNSLGGTSGFIAAALARIARSVTGTAFKLIGGGSPLAGPHRTALANAKSLATASLIATALGRIAAGVTGTAFKLIGGGSPLTRPHRAALADAKSLATASLISAGITRSRATGVAKSSAQTTGVTRAQTARITGAPAQATGVARAQTARITGAAAQVAGVTRAQTTGVARAQTARITGAAAQTTGVIRSRATGVTESAAQAAGVTRAQTTRVAKSAAQTARVAKSAAQATGVTQATAQATITSWSNCDARNIAASRERRYRRWC